MLLILPGILVTVGAAQLARRKGLRFAYITALQLRIAGLVTLASRCSFQLNQVCWI